MYCIFLFAWVLTAVALDEQTKTKIRSSFMEANELSKLNPTQSNGKGIYVENLLPQYYFYQKEAGKSTLAVVVPEDVSGNGLAQFMVSEASAQYQKYGFDPAMNLLKNTVWTVFSRELFWEAKVSALYATRDADFLEVVCAGNLWAGIFRHGHLVNSTRSEDEDGGKNSGPQGFIPNLSMVHGLRLQGLTQYWPTEPGDVLVITWSDLEISFRDIINIAVETAEVSGVPASQIMANLNPYLNLTSSKAYVVAAVRIE